MKAVTADAMAKALLDTRANRLVRSDSISESNLSTGIKELDRLIGGIPRGATTLATGPESSGRMTLMLSTIASTVTKGFSCALVDAFDSFDADTAGKSGFDLDQMLWVRCGHNLQNALRATEIVLESGGFGLVILDVASISARARQSIPDSCWFRFRRSVEKNLSSLLIVGPEFMSVSSAQLSLELQLGKARWTGGSTKHSLSRSLVGIDFIVKRRKPFPSIESSNISTSIPYDIPD